MLLHLLAQTVTYTTTASGITATPSSGPTAGLGASLAFGLAVGVAVAAVVGWLLSTDLAAVPPPYRRLEPNQAWLLMIPLFNLYWAFVVFARVPDSFAAYFDGTGHPQPGDYGRAMGKWYAVLNCCAIIPCLGSLAALAGLVLLILLLVRFNGYKNLVRVGTAGGFPVQPAPPPSAE